MRIILYILIFQCLSLLSNSKTISIKNSNFSDLINKIENSTSGDTIKINGGIYKGSGIKIKKFLTIIGYNYPIFDANGNKGDLIAIQSDSVTIDGIKIINVPKAHTTDNAAIKVINSKNITIRNIITDNCFFGIYLSKTDNSTLSNNNIQGNKSNETSSGNGVHLWRCNNINITNNKISYHRDGIYFEFVRNTKIYGNLSKFNVRYGLHYMFSDSCSYVNNKFYENGAGVAVMYTKNVMMKNNEFKDNWGTSSYGILLKDIRDSQILNNKFVNNTIGILAEGSNRIIIKNNHFEKNGWGMKMMGNCVDNLVNNNNFTGNTFDISSNSMESFNDFDGNYWSNYKGYDLDKNGIGDIPHYPVSLFSMVVQNSSPAMILMHSLFINILEVSEKIFPSIIPKKIIDNKPKMRMIND